VSWLFQSAQSIRRKITQFARTKLVRQMLANVMHVALNLVGMIGQKLARLLIDLPMPFRKLFAERRADLGHPKIAARQIFHCISQWTPRHGRVHGNRRFQRISALQTSGDSEAPSTDSPSHHE
jgi:hypothetical protein